jgi:hypothetical protein
MSQLLLFTDCHVHRLDGDFQNVIFVVVEYTIGNSSIAPSLRFYEPHQSKVDRSAESYPAAAAAAVEEEEE